MNKQDFVLTELEAMAKDMETIVSIERKLLEMEVELRVEREARRKKGESLAVMARPYNANKFIPELSWFQARLAATKEYLLSTDPLLYPEGARRIEGMGSRNHIP